MAGGRRAEQQLRNRGRILAAAREEFSQVGYRDAKIDGIAARAELTRGAVYSNFPSKRALGLTVAADLLTQDPVPQTQSTDRAEAVVSLTQAWLARLPLGGTDEDAHIKHLSGDLHAEIRADRDLRDACAELLKLDAIILARVLEHLGDRGREVRAASSLLSVLQATSALSASAPGFTDPFDVLTTGRAVADADFADRWMPPHESIVPQVQPIDRAWNPVDDAIDVIAGAPMEWPDDGIVAVLGLRQASAIEQALRSAAEGSAVTLVLVTDDPAERMPLAALVIAELLANLRLSVLGEALSGLSVILDRSAGIAHAAGLRSLTDDTHRALRIDDGRIVAQAEGPAACRAIAVWQAEAEAAQRSRSRST